jgi:ribonuclease BN (tRNA processing enzyme)
LDAGSGTLANLQRWCDPVSLSGIVLSHEHPDHWTDLEGFAVALSRRSLQRPIPVYAPPGIRERSYHGDYPILEWHQVEPAQRVVIGSLLCSFVATDHGPPTVAVRFDAREAVGPGGLAATALVYSADTGPGWSVEELGEGLGTVLCEASFTRDAEGAPGHLSGRQAGTMSADAGVGTLIVTHRWPTVSAQALADEASEAFGRPVEQASTDRVFPW